MSLQPDACVTPKAVIPGGVWRRASGGARFDDGEAVLGLEERALVELIGQGRDADRQRQGKRKDHCRLDAADALQQFFREVDREDMEDVKAVGNAAEITERGDPEQAADERVALDADDNRGAGTGGEGVDQQLVKSRRASIGQKRNRGHQRRADGGEPRHRTHRAQRGAGAEEEGIGAGSL